MLKAACITTFFTPQLRLHVKASVVRVSQVSIGGHYNPCWQSFGKAGRGLIVNEAYEDYKIKSLLSTYTGDVSCAGIVQITRKL